mgnify:CR=1 FL=1|tara:strand:+ start:172 stop:414 length:243 start_codon:yes stop_codon:yes gene_type:complete
METKGQILFDFSFGLPKKQKTSLAYWLKRFKMRSDQDRSQHTTLLFLSGEKLVRFRHEVYFFLHVVDEVPSDSQYKTAKK